MADPIAVIARALNTVESVGQARAALEAGLRAIEIGQDLAGHLSIFSSPTPDEARSTLALDQAQLAGELRTLDELESGSAIDAATWSRQRRAVERAYVDVSGIQGVVGALGRIDVVGILVEAIENAPKVFGQAAGTVLDAAGRAAGGLGSGFLEGLGVLGLLVLIALLALALKARAL
jgi:hypothetical protein